MFYIIKLSSEGLPTSFVMGLVNFIQFSSTRTSYNIYWSVGFQIGFSVVFLIENPLLKNNISLDEQKVAVNRNSIKSAEFDLSKPDLINDL